MIWLGSDKYVISKWNLSNAAVPHILSADSIRRKDLADDTPLWIVTTKYWGRIDLSQKIVSKKLSLPLFPIYVTKIKCLQYRRLVNELSLFKIVKLWKCPWLLPHGKPFVSAVLFGFHGINLFKNLVSRELLRILENFHFSISI